MLISLYTYTLISSMNHTLSKTERFGPGSGGGSAAPHTPPGLPPSRACGAEQRLQWHSVAGFDCLTVSELNRKGNNSSWVLLVLIAISISIQYITHVHHITLNIQNFEKFYKRDLS